MDKLLNKKDNHEFVEEIYQISEQKIKKRVIKAAAYKLLEATKIKGSRKFM